ncbi:hypothetical protein C8R47DRAFT_1076053 [Mycena vitilis]|nr:hypothetical protein C8R47DRAFT_1076053 [Mycena vitilis]
MLGPRSIESRATNLQHRRSTKLLINRFESLGESEHSNASRGSLRVPPTKFPLCAPKLTESKKDKSPIRQSFRNLFAVLKKSSGLRGGKSKPEGIQSNQPPAPDTTLSAEDPFTTPLAHSPLPDCTQSYKKPPVDTTPSTTSQVAGFLFYLARSSESSASLGVLPVWTFCSAVLERDSILLTWPAAPFSHSVSLKHCTDVRSFASDELDPEERERLPVEDFKVFELTVEGRAERFALDGSLMERARWISAIWDVILPGSSPLDQETSAASDPDPPGHSGPRIIHSERALPPVPVPEHIRSSTPISNAPPTPASLSIDLDAKPDSLRPSISSPSKSPSMAKLGRLSVVTQRLAQFEGNQHSAPSSPASLYHNSSRTKSLHVQIPARDDIIGLASPTSILESYGEAPSCSPMARETYPAVDYFQKHHYSSSQDGYSPDRQHGVFLAHVPSDGRDSPLKDIHNMMSTVARRTEETGNNVNVIQDQLRQPTKPELDSTAVSTALTGIDKRLCSDLPYILKLLAQIQACQSDPEHSSKLVDAPPDCDSDKLNRILELFKEDSLQRSVQTQQQTDSVRYLNELNSANFFFVFIGWLEAFVSGGTAQIGVVAAGVNRLCQELGLEKDQTILAEMRQLIVDGQAKDQTKALQASINNLVALIASESRTLGTNQFKGLLNFLLFHVAPHSVASLVDQQRQDQETLFRALRTGNPRISFTLPHRLPLDYTELSNEIRGERLRFVDAMKEATAINVQMHVEELKRELAREVRADLFEYYSKQRQPGVPPIRPMYVSQTGMAPPPHAPPNVRYRAYP